MQVTNRLITSSSVVFFPQANPLSQNDGEKKKENAEGSQKNDPKNGMELL